MGLAAPRKKTKISHDPNNTKWARSTTGFGHRIMSAQGWTPGDRLGARDAAHADLLTAASVSHIKVTIKDDTLGLGARAGRDPLGEPTGLDAFKGLLGRLNGKSDVELQQEQRKRDDVKLARYAAMKFQEVRFVRGGLLAQEKLDKSSESTPKDKFASAPTTIESYAEKDDSSGGDIGNQPKNLKPKSKSKSKANSSKEECYLEDGAKNSSSTSGLKKKEKKKGKKRKADTEETRSSSEQPAALPLQKDEKSSSQNSTSGVMASRDRRPLGRQIIRGRHIAQKRKALLDDKSLNEIFMVKA